jgi:photosystem II stability/assembly factor-like uncharacterized protein
MTPEQHVVDRLTGFYREMEQALPGAPPPWRPERTRTARGSSWRMQAVAAAGLILVAVAVAVLLQHGRPHSIVQPATSSTLTTAQPPEVGNATVPVGRLMRFVTAQDGWVVTKRGVFATHDGGQHWQFQLKLDWQAFFTLRALDSQHAIIWSNELLYATADGGDHWRASRIAPGTSGQTFFLNAREGWRETDSGDPKAPGDVAVYHTTDAGAHWTELWRAGTTQSLSRSPALAVSPLGLLFTDSRHGFMGTYSYDSVGRLYVTRDGGRTWQIAVLPPPPGGWGSGCCGKVITQPAVTMFGNLGFVELIASGAGTGRPVYRTSDGGQSWGNPFFLPVGAAGAYFPDPSHGWVTGGQTLYQTVDGGVSWRQVRLLGAPPSGLKFASGPTPTISSEVMWASASGTLPGVDETDCLQIFDMTPGRDCRFPIRSTDGGAHWTVVKLPTG